MSALAAAVVASLSAPPSAPPASPPAPKLPPFLFVLPPEPRIEARNRPTYRPLH